MKPLTIERVAVAVTVLGILVVVALPFLYESRVSGKDGGTDLRVITLTGLAATGVWTEVEVRAGNYFARQFPPAQPLLQQGERVRFRLKSADVVHDFYSPELGIGPVEVYPGRVTEVEVTPTVAGAFDYYCTTVCGDAHFRMRGQIIVAPATATSQDPGTYWLTEPPSDTSLVARGEWLFRRYACFSCHGNGGHGGVRNPNYIKDTVPALDGVAEGAYLFGPEDVEVIIDALERRVPLEDLWDDPPVALFNVVLAKYQAVRELIRSGVQAGKLDPEGPEPPLSMPAWGQVLSDRDIDALIAYLLTLQPLEHTAAASD